MTRLTTSVTNTLINLLEMFPEFYVMKDVAGYKKALIKNVDKGMIAQEHYDFIVEVLAIKNTNTYKPSVNCEKLEQIKGLLGYIRDANICKNVETYMRFKIEFLESEDSGVYRNIPYLPSVYPAMKLLLVWDLKKQTVEKVKNYILDTVEPSWLKYVYAVNIEDGKTTSVLHFSDISRVKTFNGLTLFRRLDGVEPIYVPIPDNWKKAVKKTSVMSSRDCCSGVQIRSRGC